MPQESPAFTPDEEFALAQDARDPLRAMRHEFYIPPDRGGGGDESVYFCGNSLGLQPKSARSRVTRELDDWAALAVEGHFHAADPWYRYHESLREPGARLVGALPGEVVFMNSLTVNLHLMMVSFFRPSGVRRRILIEDCAFPSDTYAVRTQLQFHGIDPRDGLCIARPRAGEHVVRDEDVVALLRREGDSIALLLLGGVNYYTGQVFDMGRITRAARDAGCIVGLDLAHAAGNVPLALHDWGVDFAAWCCYKYLNSGPGAVAGCFVHQRHHGDASLPRFGGWWGNDPRTRFRMHLEPEFVPVASADAWQLSNPPILSLAPVKSSLELFDRATMPALREKSRRLTGYLQFLLDQLPSGRFEVITPRAAESRGCQLSILAHERPRELFAVLQRAGVVCDFREPNVVRVAPTPMYNTFHEVWRFARILGAHK